MCDFSLQSSMPSLKDVMADIIYQEILADTTNGCNQFHGLPAFT